MIEKIAPSGHGPVNLREMLITLTNDVVCRAAFGRKYSSNGGGDAVSFNEIFKDFVELISCFHIGDFMPWLGWVSRIKGLQDRVELFVKQFDQFLEGIIEEHLERQKKQKNSDDSVKEEKVKDFVDVLIEIESDKTVGLPIDRDSIKALILDVFAAGKDTTYTVAEWAMTEILRHPSAMKEVQAEVRGLAGSKDQINESDLEKMKYLRAKLKETLRFIHPLPCCLLDQEYVKINGYDIAAGTLVITNAWSTHRDPSSCEDPDEFGPERFLDSAVGFRGHYFQLIPFGVGRRGCPGLQFTLANNKLVLANPMHKFDWKLPAGAEATTLDTSECIGQTIHRKNPLIATAIPYCGSWQIPEKHFNKAKGLSSKIEK
ncbi:Cytochrome P450 736A117-like protein [Drosera capensis]